MSPPSRLLALRRSRAQSKYMQLSSLNPVEGATNLYLALEDLSECNHRHD